MSNQDTTVNDPTDNNELDPQADGSQASGPQASGSQASGAPTNQPESGPGETTEPTVEIPPHEQEMTKLRAERDLLEQKLQRAMADTQNIRRRQRQEMDDSRRRVLEGLTQELLPVLDSFTLALQAYDDSKAEQSSEDATSALVEGVRMVKTLLTGALERHGLEEIKAIGLPFDPSRHEALGVEPNGEVDENQVVRVVQTGYLLGEHVVRHSKVIVAGPEQD